VSEHASHAERSERIYRSTESEVRTLIGKQPDAIIAHLVIDAEEQIEQRDNTAQMHVVWVNTYALARCASFLQWALTRVQQLEIEAAGQERLFDEDAQ